MVFTAPGGRSRTSLSSGKKQITAPNAPNSSSALRFNLGHKRISPKRRTSDWLQNTETPAKKPIQKVTKPATSRTSRGSKARSKKAKRKSWVSRLWFYVSSKLYKDQPSDKKPIRGPDFEGVTLIGDSSPPKPSILGKSVEKTPATLTQKSDTVLVDGDSPLLAKSRGSHSKRSETADSVTYPGWTEDEVWLFEKLDRRGCEPLLPRHWDRDFLTMYALLFTKNDSAAFIRSASGKDYHAIKALRGLVKLSGHVRDRDLYGFSLEETLHREIHSYFRWSMCDAGLSKTQHIPAIVIATAAPEESVLSLVNRVTDQLHDLGNQYRALWLDAERSAESVDRQYYVHDLPTLYGVVIKSSLVSFVTYDVAQIGQGVRCLGVYNFKKEGQDIWHALAVSIIFIRARNYLMELRAEEELGEEIDDDAFDEDW